MPSTCACIFLSISVFASHAEVPSEGGGGAAVGSSQSDVVEVVIVS